MKVAVAAGATAVALLAAEVGLRTWSAVSDPGVADVGAALRASAAGRPDAGAGATSLRGLVMPAAEPDVVYRLRPDLDVVFKGVPVRTDSHGMRGPERRPERAPGGLRIAGLGDSVMFGWGVAERDSYLAVVERRLRADGVAGGDVEVLNFAVPGYNTAMEVADYRSRVREFRPDVVVLEFVHNDLELPRFMLRPPDPWALDRSWLLDLAFGGGAPRASWLEPNALADLPEDERARVHADYRHLVGTAAVERALDELAGTAREDGAAVVLLTLADRPEPYTAAVGRARELGFGVALTGPIFSRYLRDHGLPSTDASWAATFWRSSRDPHPNALGHALYAEAVVEAVRPLVGRSRYNGGKRAAGAGPTPVPG